MLNTFADPNSDYFVFSKYTMLKTLLIISVNVVCSTKKSISKPEVILNDAVRKSTKKFDYVVHIIKSKV